MTGASTPASCLPLAQHLLGQYERRAFDVLEADPGYVAWRDQVEAAGAEVRASLERMAALLPWGEVQVREPGERSIAFTLAVSAAIVRRCWHGRCRHARERMGARPGPLVASLSEKRVACPDCARRWRPLLIDDGVCDCCEAPTSVFTEHMLTLPQGVLVHANLCDDCQAWA